MTLEQIKRKVVKLIVDIESTPINDFTNRDEFEARVDTLLDLLNAAWSNDAIAHEAREAKNELLEAWHKATN